jgi:hypothetical protein
MSAATLTKPIGEVSPRSLARMAGAFYFAAGLTGGFHQAFVLGRLVVAGNAAATSNNITAHRSLFWFGFAAALVSPACDTVKTVLFYDLFKPVNKRLSLIAMFFGIIGCVLQAFITVFFIAPLVIVEGGQYLSAFNVEHLQVLTLMFFKLTARATDIYLVFFGFYCVLIGYLILRSTFMPRIIGLLMVLTGLGYCLLLYPPLAHYLWPYNLAPAALGETSLMLWLLVVGVNVQRWKEQATATEYAAPVFS